MLRDEWHFQYAVGALLEAANLKVLEHSRHEREWADKYDGWSMEMNETARVEEMPITGGTQRVLRYDQGLQTKVNEAQSRRDNHKARRELYERWIRALGDEKPERMLELDIDDVEFFGL